MPDDPEIAKIGENDVIRAVRKIMEEDSAGRDDVRDAVERFVRHAIMPKISDLVNHDGPEKFAAAVLRAETNLDRDLVEEITEKAVLNVEEEFGGRIREIVRAEIAEVLGGFQVVLKPRPKKPGPKPRRRSGG